MRSLHERMPVILDPSVDGLWLDLRTSAYGLRALFVPHPCERMVASPVGLWVNAPKHEGPRCLEPVDVS